MRRQIFRQMKQKAEWILDVFTSIFVKYESLFRIWRMQIACKVARRFLCGVALKIAEGVWNYIQKYVIDKKQENGSKIFLLTTPQSQIRLWHTLGNVLITTAECALRWFTGFQQYRNRRKLRTCLHKTHVYACEDRFWEEYRIKLAWRLCAVLPQIYEEM